MNGPVNDTTTKRRQLHDAIIKDFVLTDEERALLDAALLAPVIRASTMPSAGVEMIAKKIEASRGIWSSVEHSNDIIPNLTDMERDIIIAALRGGSSPVNGPAQQIAAEIAPDLDRLINEFMECPGGNDESERRRTALKTFLWENKVGLLRVAQSMTSG